MIALILAAATANRAIIFAEKTEGIRDLTHDIAHTHTAHYTPHEGHIYDTIIAHGNTERAQSFLRNHTHIATAILYSENSTITANRTLVVAQHTQNKKAHHIKAHGVPKKGSKAYAHIVQWTNNRGGTENADALVPIIFVSLAAAALIAALAATAAKKENVAIIKY